MAVLPMENLTSEPSLDWMERAVAAVVASVVSGSESLHAIRADTRRDAANVRATQILHGYFVRAGGALRVTAHLEDLRTGRTTRVLTASAPASGALALGQSLASQITSKPGSFSTTNQDALRLYAESLGPAATTEMLEKALTADPNFSDARWLLAQSRLARGDAATALQLALEKRSADARLEALTARIQGDRTALAAAQQKVAHLYPADSEAAGRAGDALIAVRRIPEAVEWYRKATALEPTLALMWNARAYAHAYAGDQEAARASLSEYGKLDPAGANPSDSLGEILFYFGRFDEAEKAFLAAHAKDPRFLGGATLAKAAESALMRGASDDASKLALRFVEARRAAGDPAIGLWQAQWDHLTGRRPQAIERVLQFAAGNEKTPDVAASGWIQAAVWKLLAGDRAGAADAAVRASAQAGSGNTRQLAAACRFLSQPPATAAEWSRRAQAESRPALAYALLLNGHYRESIAPMQEMLAQAHPNSNGLVKLVLAWALVESGRHAEAQPLLATHPLPSNGGWDAFYSLVFPRCFLLRAQVLEKSGDAAGAARQRELFNKYR